MAQNTRVAADANAPPVTRLLAEFVALHPSAEFPASVEREAERTLLNWVGCAIGASRHSTLAAALAAVQELAPSPQAAVLGRNDRVDMGSAALLNGISSHTFDFDDTHLKTIIHPAGPVASAALALGEHIGSTGRAFVDALVLGVDVACRVGNMVYPEHYDRGWHITGSTGMLGAAAGCARLLSLDVDRTAMALGIAASQPVGVREQFGSMSKPFHPGAAARAGLTSALMARHGFTASSRAIEAPRGLAQTYSTKCAWDEITDELGERFEISFNTYKPFACGIVIHPSIDGCVQLRNDHRLRAQDIARIDLRVHSLVLELTGKRAPRTGLEGKFSVYHACAAAIVFGQAGQAEFADEVVARDDIIALRGRIHAVADSAIDEAAADVSVTLNDGRKHHVFIEHAIGSLERPMTDDQLAHKFHGLVDPVLGRAQADDLIGYCKRIAAAKNVRALGELARPR
ncbi:MAG TPA: MmgE/PrpD family protein [Casimicrobiaceae bacterium]|nr:MmgE/PrpD family protein [Casimicrobiaceae bacterium]